MKPNVDLTEHRLFTSRTEHADILANFFAKQMPWNKRITEISSDSELGIMCSDSKKRSYFPTGNKGERERIIKARLERKKRCEDCEQLLPKCPWIKHECNAYSMTIKKRIPWIF